MLHNFSQYFTFKDIVPYKSCFIYSAFFSVDVNWFKHCAKLYREENMFLPLLNLFPGITWTLEEPGSFNYVQ